MDDQDDVWMVQHLNVVEEDEDPLLFIRPDGIPMAFFYHYTDYDLKFKVEDRGGVLLIEEYQLFNDNMIKLCSDKLEHMKSTEEQFDKKFIDDCIKENKIVNLRNYRMNSSSKFADYDPIDVLCGYISWNEVEEISTEYEDDVWQVTQSVVYDDGDYLSEDDVLGRSLLNEAPTNWELLTEDEAVSYGIKFEKSEGYLSEDDVLGRSLLNEAPTNWEILTEDEAISYGIKFEKSL